MLSTDQQKGNELLHLGHLCRRIRVARGISVSAVAAACGVSDGTISRAFEQDNQLGKKTFEKYLRALSTQGAYPLTAEQITLLNRLYQEKGRRKQQELCLKLAEVDLDYVNPKTSPLKTPDDLKEMVNRLKKEKLPAYIMDDLWFIHAVNTALFRLFGVEPDSDFFRRWEAWHSLAIKIPSDSRIRSAQSQVDTFLPQTLAFFLEDERTYPYLFTPQMKALVARLVNLSKQHGHDFPKWWDLATAFLLPFTQKSAPRTIAYSVSAENSEQKEIRYIQVNPKIIDTKEVRVNWVQDEYVVQYTYTALEPVGNDANSVFKDIFSNYSDSQKILYANDFDSSGDFHVNMWPEVEPHLT